uniref:MFS-type transporter SLC18B1-like n=1 Tax=Phallusia mammillata TaxID=59560 RepID=A0A6F9DRQ2_9ASCI|nr:MFS-type transporter SLC18B1-like [Phallusia mammillata]
MPTHTQGQVNYAENVSSPLMKSRNQHEENHNQSHSKAAETSQLVERHVFPDIQVLNPTPGSYGSVVSNSTAGTATTVYMSANTGSYASSPGQYLEVGSGPKGLVHTPIDNFAENLAPSDEYNGARNQQAQVPMRPCIHRTSTPIIISYAQPSALPPSETQREDLKRGEDKENRRNLAQYTRRQWIALAAVCYINFSSNANFSILSSFFGVEAINHGASDLEVGFIFSSYAIANTIFCPLYGFLIPMFGPKPLLLFGVLLSSACSFLFSQMHLIAYPKMFVFACLSCRCVQALGCAAYFVASVVIIAQEWKDSVTFAMGISEVFTGLGMIGGPLLGGWLYEQGGFQLPFLVAGLIMFVGLFVSYYSIHNEQGASTLGGNFLTLLRKPNIAATVILMCVMWAAMDFNMPILALHMEALNASPVVVGAMFFILATGYILCAPLIGFLAKTKKSERTCMIIGGLLTAFSYLLIGPSPLFDFFQFSDLTLGSVALSMSLLGIGLSTALVPIFNDLTNSAVESGMADDLVTAGVVGGIFNGGTFFGEFIGPTVEGILMNHFKDYRVVSSIFSAFIFIMVLSVGIFYVVDWHTGSHVPKSKAPPCLDTVQQLQETSEGDETQRLLQ